MYMVIFVDQWGHAYTNFGLTQKFGKSDDFVKKEYQSFDRAKKYANAFIRRYPHTIANIYRDDELIAEFGNDEYSVWRENRAEKWRQTYKGTKKLTNFFAFLIVGFIAIVSTLLVHWLDAYNLSIWAKIPAVYFILITSWWLYQRIFMRIQ